MNQKVLMSGAEYFTDEFAINPYYGSGPAVDTAAAVAEHKSIQAALKKAGVEIVKVDAPPGCQDGVYTANWGLCRGNKCVLSSLPNKRSSEEPYAEKVLHELGKEVTKPPMRFSGQGDALPCGDYLFAGSTYRTDPAIHKFLADTLGFKVISLQTVPKLDDYGQPLINSVTGWPDSFFYDIDLALSVLTPNLIAWCPSAFTPQSQDKISALPMGKIEVSHKEAVENFACNLLSTGQTVVMSNSAPQFKAAIEARGLKTITPRITELGKGGGYIRCTTLTLE